MTSTKLNVLLAKTDHLAASYKKQLEEYVKFSKNSQGAFKGEKKTYDPLPGTQDIPSYRGNALVVTTVVERLEYLEKGSKEYLDALFSLEKTNASGLARARLVVDGIDFGEFTSMELLRLKSLLENGTFTAVYENIPVRNDNETWKLSKNEMYDGREIYESEKMSNKVKTTMKESYILEDPNVAKGDSIKYVPQVATKDTIIELGDSTFQKFSGEASHRERAGMLLRRSKLVTAVIEALKISNEVEAVPSDMSSEKLFSYIRKGTI